MYTKELKLAADIGQYVIPIAAGSYAIYQEDYKEAVFFSIFAACHKVGPPFLKKMFPKKRPDGRDGSFPSTHTAGAFLGVGLLAGKYGLSSLTGAAFVAACLVGVSRYITKDHWPVDILAGACIGLANGFLAGTQLLTRSSE